MGLPTRQDGVENRDKVYTEEDSLPTSSVSQSLSVTTPSSPSHRVKRSASGRFAKAAKGTSNKMTLMQQGYRNYMAKRKLDFENITDENEPPSKRNTRSTQVSTAVTVFRKILSKYQARVYANHWKHQIFMLITGCRRKRSSSSPWNSSN